MDLQIYHHCRALHFLCIGCVAPIFREAIRDDPSFDSVFKLQLDFDAPTGKLFLEQVADVMTEEEEAALLLAQDEDNDDGGVGEGGEETESSNSPTEPKDAATILREQEDEAEQAAAAIEAFEQSKQAAKAPRADFFGFRSRELLEEVVVAINQGRPAPEDG